MSAALATAKPPAELELGRRDFERIVRLLREVAGIHMPDGKQALVFSRLAKRVRALGLASFEEYVRVLEERDAGEIDQMLTALTTNVTRFFREPHHFDDLEGFVREELGPKARAGARVRIWSAGCSSGEEPYSAALAVLAALPDAAALDVRLLATDINETVLAHGRRGVYPRAALQKAPEALIASHFEAAGEGQLSAGPALRRLVAFRRLNFIEAWPMKGPFDAVFCRNAMIYFDAADQAEIQGRMTTLLRPGGRLYLGHSERALPPASERLRSLGMTAYERGPA
jgi:chemotaxis protein methyltransferase CheR